MSEEKLKDFLKTGKDWSILVASVSEIFGLKIPIYKRSSTRLTVWINPLNNNSKSIKRRGLILRSKNEFEKFSKTFQMKKLTTLSMLDSVNPKTRIETRRKEKEILEL